MTALWVPMAPFFFGAFEKIGLWALVSPYSISTKLASPDTRINSVVTAFT
ncbi:MAG: hypothetical protein RIQ68_1816 [Pseudomonadota bacterium]